MEAARKIKEAALLGSLGEILKVLSWPANGQFNT
jgi:hypothetical protein